MHMTNFRLKVGVLTIIFEIQTGRALVCSWELRCAASRRHRPTTWRAPAPSGLGHERQPAGPTAPSQGAADAAPGRSQIGRNRLLRFRPRRWRINMPAAAAARRPVASSPLFRRIPAAARPPPSPHRPASSSFGPHEMRWGAAAAAVSAAATAAAYPSTTVRSRPPAVSPSVPVAFFRPLTSHHILCLQVQQGSPPAREEGAAGRRRRSGAAAAADERFAPRFDGLRFMETLVTAHR